MLLAFDDTDDAAGGCTTRVLLDVLAALPGLAPLGPPRLVRLNPNVPWKTRGNAAVCVALGEPTGPRARVGEWRGMELVCHPEGRPAVPDEARLEAAWAAVRKVARPKSGPAVVLFPEAPPQHHYWAAVREVVDSEDALEAIEAEGALWRAMPGRRGLVGCLAAAAWPGPPASFEFLAYREPARVGTRRAVDPAPLVPLDAQGATFHTYDPEAGRLACVPGTPDPVLCGLRGRDPDLLRDAAVAALLRAAQEPVDAWLLYASNQASGDHVTPVETLLDAPELGTVEVEATVARTPERLQGGHVFARMHDLVGVPFQAAAFEPTKSLRAALAALRKGDRVRVVGAYDGATVKLEKFEVLELARHEVKTANPACPSCGKRMKSAGAGAGYRCPACGAKAAPDAAAHEAEPRTIGLGWHEAPVVARRHLHRPAAWDAPTSRSLPMASEGAGAGAGAAVGP